MAQIISKRLFLYLWTITLLLIYTNGHHTFLVYWNRTSFKPYQDDSLIFEVRLGDVMDLICPFYDEQESYMLNDFEQYDIYRVTKNEYDLCSIDQFNLDPTTRIIITCNSPYEVMKYTLNFRSYLPIPNGLEFHSNQTYYLLSTSTLSSSHQQCYKLKINVHDYQRTLASSSTVPSLNEKERHSPIISHKSNPRVGSSSSTDKAIEYNEHHHLFSKIVKAERHSDPYSIKWITKVPSSIKDFEDKTYRITNSISSSPSNTLSLALSSSSSINLSVSFISILILTLFSI
ncbi:hypothetical protein I4U23_024382 [Adineta vaga]|nr:hypothetical protein I4U23_024382 [Adineta vaga]